MHSVIQTLTKQSLFIINHNFKKICICKIQLYECILGVTSGRISLILLKLH